MLISWWRRRGRWHKVNRRAELRRFRHVQHDDQVFGPDVHRAVRVAVASDNMWRAVFQHPTGARTFADDFNEFLRRRTLGYAESQGLGIAAI